MVVSRLHSTSYISGLLDKSNSEIPDSKHSNVFNLVLFDKSNSKPF